MHRLCVTLLTGLGILLTSPCFADGLFLNGISPRSIGRGGTNLGHADNGAILFDNPAAMTRIQGTQLSEFAVDVLITDFEYSDPQNTQTVSSSIGTALPQFSMIRKSADGQFAYGLGVFTPAGFSESYFMNPVTPFVGPQAYDSFGSLTKILPGIAWAPNDRLSVGGTLGVGISHVEIDAPYFVQSGPFTGTPIVLDLQGTGAALVWSLAAQYEVNCDTTLGITYHSESRFRLDGPARVDLGMGNVRFDADTYITWPRSLGVGVTHRTARRGTFSADLIWFDWSDSFDNLGVALGGPLTLNDTFPLNWRDTLSVRLGHEIDLGCGRTFRLGYVYHRNPIPAATITPLIQAITEHGISTGYGFQLCGLEIDCAYMLTIGEDVEVGTSQLVGGDFSDARHGAVTHAIAIGATKRF